mmetsp:Transcript_20146/g.51295  ORF Transcript_20146/g.51295 Transcript_20146/m.51295 type:complete len:304 (+) Transcript_20146:1-912(+)
MISAVGLIAVASSALLTRSPVVVFGAGSSNELQLLTAKIASRAGHNAAIYSPDDNTAKNWRRIMYGQEYAQEGADADGNARVIIGTNELGQSLASAKALCLVCDSAPMPEGTCKLLLENAPELDRVVLLSKMGVTRAKPAGPFGIGGEDAALLENERTIKNELAKRDLDLSILRVGVLKGGGPGGEQGKFNQGDAEIGLARAYLDGIAELETYMTTQSYDRFTLGASCTAGDPIDLPNAFVRATNRGSFEPREFETSRIAAATAMVQAVSHPVPVELSISASKSEVLPTEEEWTAMFNAVTSA